MNRGNGRLAGHFSPLFLLWCCLSLLLFPLPGLFAQETPLPNSPMSISERLINLKENSKKLEQLWAERKIAYSEAVRLSSLLEIELDEVRKLLATSREFLAISQLELTRSIDLFTRSQSTLNSLRESFREYQASAAEQIRRLEIERWIYRGVIVFLMGVAVRHIVRMRRPTGLLAHTESRRTQ